MDIKNIDKNFADVKADADGLKRYSIPCGAFDLYGVFHDGNRFLRLPEDIAANTSEGVKWLNTNTAGGRVRFSTNSKRVEISATYEGLSRLPHMPLSGSGGFTLIDETDPSSPFLAAAYFPEYTAQNGFSICKDVKLGGAMRNYILYMPLYNDVKSLTIGLDGDAAVKGGRKYKDVKPILYYGSSITQGGCASRPDASYQAVISLWNNVDYINLGFSGNGKAERIMADYLSGLDCGVFVCDYDHNAPNAEYLNNTHFNLYKTFRKKHKDVPIIFMTKPDPEREPEAKERVAIIEKTYKTALENGDKNVYFINGYDLFGDKDRMLCTVDGCHPTDRGFYLMAEKLYKIIKELV